MGELPWDLDYWKSDDWKIVDQKLTEMEKANVRITPARRCLFESLRRVPLADVRVVWVGQDPYPGFGLATGVAFEVPSGASIPPTLRAIFGEYRRDLGYPVPRSGSLRRWTEQGVLLWNAIPCTLPGRSLACDWREWRSLTSEVLRSCAARGVVFVFSGAVARGLQEVQEVHAKDNCRVIETSHPSPRGSLRSQVPFVGSRIFSTINAKLREIALPTIEWELKDAGFHKAPKT